MKSPVPILTFRKHAVAAVFCLALLASCKDLFQFNPNEVRLEESESDLNAKNIQKIMALPQRDTFRFIVAGDSQRFYDDLDDFVNTVNGERDIAFVILNGDISDFGLNREFKWVGRSLRRLKVPFIGVIGNHDMLANGRMVYRQMFGPENFSFDYSGSRFICLNTSSRETGYDGTVPDLDWLRREVAQLPAHKQGVVLSHVPPFDADFDSAKGPAFDSILAASGKISISIHGHQHRFSSNRPYASGLEYLVVSSVQKRNYAVITFASEDYTVEQKFF